MPGMTRSCTHAGLQNLDDSAHVAPGGRRDGDDDLFDLVPFNQLRNGFNRTQHLDAVDVCGLLRGVVVDEADRPIAPRVGLHQLPEQRFPRVAGANDQDVLSVTIRLHLQRQLAQLADTKSVAADDEQREQPLDDKDRSRDTWRTPRVCSTERRREWPPSSR